jgi:hypothetical protein
MLGGAAYLIIFAFLERRMRGKNFGFTELPLSVSVGGLVCTATWLNDGLLSCFTARDVVGT